MATTFDLRPLHQKDRGKGHNSGIIPNTEKRSCSKEYFQIFVLWGEKKTNLVELPLHPPKLETEKHYWQ